MKAISLIVLSSILFTAHCSPAAVRDTKTWIEEGRKRDETNIGNKFQGDMNLGKDQLAKMKKRNFDSLSKRWPNGVIPYSVDDSASTYRNWIDQAAAHIGEATDGCVRFVPFNGEADYVSISSGDGCWADIGYRGGEQSLSLQVAPICNWYGVVIHEMMHAAGMSHEHTRFDRDDYLTIYMDNVDPDPNTRSNFNKINGNTYSLPFDYESIMLYGPYLFSANGQKTTARNDGEYQKDLSEKDSLSPLDVAKIKAFYGCS